MAFPTGFWTPINRIFMTGNASGLSRPVRSCFHFFVGNISVTVNTQQFRLLDMEFVGNPHMMGFAHFAFGDLWVTTETVIIDPFIGIEKHWKPLTRLSMTIRTGHLLRMNLRRGPHGKIGLFGMTGEANDGMGR